MSGSSGQSQRDVKHGRSHQWSLSIHCDYIHSGLRGQPHLSSSRALHGDAGHERTGPALIPCGACSVSGTKRWRAPGSAVSRDGRPVDGTVHGNRFDFPPAPPGECEAGSRIPRPRKSPVKGGRTGPRSDAAPPAGDARLMPVRRPSHLGSARDRQQPGSGAMAIMSAVGPPQVYQHNPGAAQNDPKWPA